MSVATSTSEVEIGHFVAAEGEPFGSWELPGMGDSAPGCGQVSAVTFCDGGGHIHYRAHQCGRRECPDCWSQRWAGPRTVNVVSRLAAARYAADEAAGKRCVHVAVSPEGLPNTIEGFYQGRRTANEIAKEHGISGGVVVAHGYRPTQATAERYEGLQPDLSMWWWIRENERPWREQVEWSPHYHVIGLADVESVDPETGQPGHIVPGEEARDGWVFKNIRSLRRYEGPRDVEGIEDMVGAVRYLLSHTTFPAEQSRQAVTWFGALHGTNFNPEEDISRGSWSVIQRITEEVAGAKGELGSADDLLEVEEDEQCPVEGCEGNVHDLWGARAYLDTVRGSVPEEQRHRIRTAYEWATNQVKPPPGLRNPTSEKEARETLAFLLENGTNARKWDL